MTKEEIVRLQQQVLDLQLDVGDDTLGIELRRLQNYLYDLWEHPPSPMPRDIIQDPVPPGLPLTPQEFATYVTFTHYHASMLQYAGPVNRQQWDKLVDTAADMTIAAYKGGGMPIITYVPEAPTAASPQPYARNGNTGTWVPTIAGAAGAGILAYNGTSQTWVPTTPSPPTSGGNYVYNGTSGLWVDGATLYAPLTNSGANNYATTAGVTNGSNATAGQVGEYMTASSGNVSVAATGWTAIISLSLTAGDWSVWGSGEVAAPLPTTFTFLYLGVNNSVASPANPIALESIGVQSGNLTAYTTISVVPNRFNVTTSTTVYLVSSAGFSGGTLNVVGTLVARRMR